MPDVVLSDELGRSIRLSDFHGKALAFTFVFSRCPLPEFCPRMSRSFQTARSILESRNGKPNPWQFLSISFDPEFDKPAVLRRYARSYRGENTNQWLFASVSTNALPVLSRQLDLSINRDQGSFSHNLRTVVLDPAGRIHTLFAGNQWTAQQLAESLVDAAQAAPR